MGRALYSAFGKWDGSGKVPTITASYASPAACFFLSKKNGNFHQEKQVGFGFTALCFVLLRLKLRSLEASMLVVFFFARALCRAS